MIFLRLILLALFCVLFASFAVLTWSAGFYTIASGAVVGLGVGLLALYAVARLDGRRAKF